jgi:hypothetical protein
MSDAGKGSGISQRLDAFLFPARSTIWIGWLRIGLGLGIIIYSLSLWHDWNYLFAATSNGLVNRELSEAIVSLDSAFIPRLGWLVAAGARLGLGEEVSLRIALAGLLGSGICLAAGFLSRPAAILAWLVHLAARCSGAFTSYGVDNFITIGLFYLMLCPMPDCYSLDNRLWKSRPANPLRVGFHQRVLQLHLSLIYFFAGLAKCLGAGWWNGASIWRALTRPPFNVFSPEFVLRWNPLLPLAGIAICLIEFGYPFFIWPRRTRPVLLVCVVAMHIGIAIAMGLYLFAFVLIVLNLAAFAPDELARRFPRSRAFVTCLPRS